MTCDDTQSAYNVGGLVSHDTITQTAIETDADWQQCNCQQHLLKFSAKKKRRFLHQPRDTVSRTMSKLQPGLQWIMRVATVDRVVTYLFHGVINKLQSRPVSDVVTVPWHISNFVCSGVAVTEWEWDYKPLIHSRQYCRHRRLTVHHEISNYPIQQHWCHRPATTFLTCVACLDWTTINWQQFYGFQHNEAAISCLSQFLI